MHELCILKCLSKHKSAHLPLASSAVLNHMQKLTNHLHLRLYNLLYKQQCECNNDVALRTF